MTRIGYAAAALATAFLVSSASAQTPAPASHAGAQHDTHAFVEKMTIVNLAEVQLGRMAERQGQNADVKEFGEQMVKDHTEANEKLQQIAAKLNVKAPTEIDAKHKALADKLSTLQGSAFDREYITAMVQGHEEVRATLRTKLGTGGSSATSQDDLTAWAQDTLKHVEEHLEEARELHRKVAAQ